MLRTTNRIHVPRTVAIAMAIAALLFALWEASIVVPLAFSHDHTVGLDLQIYLERTRAWIDGHGFYLARQLGGPYVIAPGDALYPPPVLYLLVPMLYLPAILWWAPVVLIAAVLWYHRPVWWTWPLLALVLCLPRTWEDLLYGNPVLWATGAIAVGTIWGWPYVGALLKPTVAILALLGARRRSWWIALGVAVVLSLPFGLLWVDYAHALLDARNDFGIDYLFGELPLAAAPVIAWAGRTRPPRDRPA